MATVKKKGGYIPKLQCILNQFCEVHTEHVEFNELLGWIESGQRIALGQQIRNAENNSESKICEGTAAVEICEGTAAV